MSNLSELLPTGGGQNAVNFVASGTLSSGQTVALKSDGTVEAVSSGAANYLDFIGITASAIANTATGSVNTFGGINEAQSGLTIGSHYYVQSDGSISTTASAVKIGQAISATTINMMDLT